MVDNKGFTLLELLIALLIIAIGVLGHAKMQMKSMDTAYRATFAQTANTALLDLAQRMRANAVIAPSFVESNLTSGDVITAINCSTSNCSNAQFAKTELKEWFTHLQGSLPSPRFSVAKAGKLYTLTLIWDASRTGSGTAICDASGNTNQCGSMEVWIP
jgi:type IV pilus assembly protein PilV